MELTAQHLSSYKVQTVSLSSSLTPVYPDEMMELDFRRWVMRNFCALKEHVLNQCKETKNLEKRFEEMITKMDNLERNMNELKELKNTRTS